MTVQRGTYGRRRRAARRGGKRIGVRVLAVLACAVLFAGMFMQVSMLARISSQSKRASALESEIELLYADAENLELNINQYHNLDDIAKRARQMGLEQPAEGQIRVVNVAYGGAQGAAAQAAGIPEQESIQN